MSKESSAKIRTLELQIKNLTRMNGILKRLILSLAKKGEPSTEEEPSKTIH